MKSQEAELEEARKEFLSEGKALIDSLNPLVDRTHIRRKKLNKISYFKKKFFSFFSGS